MQENLKQQHGLFRMRFKQGTEPTLPPEKTGRGGRGRKLREGSVASSPCEEGREAQACSIRSEQSSTKF
eukprot:768709-Hanusia_phi.AAC.2